MRILNMDRNECCYQVNQKALNKFQLSKLIFTKSGLLINAANLCSFKLEVLQNTRVWTPQVG